MNKEVKRLYNLIAKHQASICKIQANCKHPKETLVYEDKSDTGNWCPDDDSYWAVYECHECGKWWTDDQRKWDGIEKYSLDYQILMRKLEENATPETC